MAKLSVPTAIVLSVVILVWGFLTWKGAHMPASMSAAVGAVVLAFLQGLFGGGSGGSSSSSGSSSSTSSSGAPKPPASPRLAYVVTLALALVGAILISAAVGLAGALVVACAGSNAATPLEQSEIATYAAGQAECVAIAKTREDAEGCRNALKRYWCGDGGPLQQAGACSFPTDGGTDR